MIVFVGLGNIGDAYADTKHNAGFWSIDQFAARNNLAFDPGKGDYVFSQIKSSQVLLIKPTTGMNKSGIAVKDVMTQWELIPSEVVVVLDDVDLPLGSIRIRRKGGDGCHRGLENIIYQVRTNKFSRIRLGIAEPSKETRPSEEYVLKPFDKDSGEKVEEMIQRCADAMQDLVIKGLDYTMNRFNT